jgi:SAM-dependent methyltransferase
MLEERSLTEEQMDAAELDPATYARVLRDLSRANVLTMNRRPTLSFLDRATKGAKRFRILDVGYGAGDMLRAIAAWAARRGLDVELIGIDLNPKSEAIARAATSKSLPIAYVSGDYASLKGQGFDLIISSLVAHHMTKDQLIGFLRFMDSEAKHGWLVNDLHRHGFAWAGYPLLARVMGWHRIVREDGQLSIARSYRPAEWPPLLREAGIEGATVKRAFPFRLCVELIR